ncbi:MAG TPA: YkgJ family cysteine cluster protein [Thermomicrobiaceae bacterium]|nr:YkgJ family cysteine cluster protein [Thermomicrobiaceae bacterium]
MSAASGRCPCDGHCCRRYAVNVCGYDVWRISTGLRLRPEQFLVTFPLPEPRFDGFRLEPDGPLLGLLLDKRGRRGQGNLRLSLPCIFLVTFTDGIERCGIYAERPFACRSYPMVARDGDIAPRPDALCPDGCWRLDDETKPAWNATLRRQTMQLNLYAEVASRWNARVAAAAPGTTFPVLEYFSYLLNVYDQIDRLGQELGPEQMARVEASWPAEPPGGAPLDRALPWVDYFLRARDALREFYPEVASPH